VIAQQTLGKNLKQTYLPSFLEKQCMCAIGCESAPGDSNKANASVSFIWKIGSPNLMQLILINSNKI